MRRHNAPVFPSWMLTRKLRMPLVASAFAHWVFGLAGVPLLAATMCAALPTAQNVFVFAVRYQTSVPLARDLVSTTTVACIPALIVIAGLLS